MAEADKRQEYEVTARAGKRVAGHVVVKGNSLLLTEAEAEFGLAEGTIVKKGGKLSEAFTTDTKVTTRLREEGQAFRGRGLPPVEPEAEPAAPKPVAGAQA